MYRYSIINNTTWIFINNLKQNKIKLWPTELNFLTIQKQRREPFHYFENIMLSDFIFNNWLYFRLGADKPGELKEFFYLKSTDLSHRTIRCDNSTIPKKSSNFLRIYCVSDTHERHETLENIPQSMECDILIHAGDIFMTSRMLSRNVSVWPMNATM